MKALLLIALLMLSACASDLDVDAPSACAPEGASREAYEVACSESGVSQPAYLCQRVSSDADCCARTDLTWLPSAWIASCVPADEPEARPYFDCVAEVEALGRPAQACCGQSGLWWDRDAWENVCHGSVTGVAPVGTPDTVVQ